MAKKAKPVLEEMDANQPATKTDICKAIGIARPTLDEYLKLPGAPVADTTGFTLDAVTKFISKQGKSERTCAKTDDDIKALKTRELRLKCERLQLKLEAERGLYWSKADVSETVRQIAQTQRAVLQRKLESELPPKLLGLGVVEMTEHMKTTVDDICRILNDRTQQWQ